MSRWVCWLFLFAVAQLPAQPLVLTDAQRDYLQTKQKLRYCIDPSWPPFESVGPDGQHRGMSADYVSFFRSQLPIPLELLPTASWPDSVAAAEQRRCDLLLLAMPTPSRRQFMNFTKPYLVIPSVIVTRTEHPRVKSVAELGNALYGIRRGFGFAELYRQFHPTLQLVEVQSYEEGLLMVQSGQLTGMFGNMGSLGYLLQQYKITNLKIAGRLPGDSELSIASRNDEPLLHEISQLLIEQIDPALQQQIDNHWLSVRMETSEDYRLVLSVTAAALLVLSALVWAYLQVRRLNRQLLQANVRLAHQSLHDGLTGLYNRAFMDEKLPACLSLCQREQIPLTLAVLDLDHFKQINDLHGHLFGDQCLRQFATLLQQHFQRPADMLVRFGGEEFVLVSVGGDETTMAQMLEQFVTALAAVPVVLAQQTSFLTVSIGWLCQVPARGQTAAQWLNQADKALYQAKANGRNGTVQTEWVCTEH
ncbi:diguanylate cyclase [Rheinheimera sp.]|uniref:diguanylate cyclase n=1 Tax=Rheinheimera sp. TaxID=1869214 RepID=UPI003D2A34D7